MKLVKDITAIFLAVVIFAGKGYCGAQEYMDAGDNYLQAAKFEKAIIEYQKVVDNYPDSLLTPEVLLRMGSCYMALFVVSNIIEDIESSNDCAKKIITDYPDTTQAIGSYFLLGGNYLVLKDTDTAIYWLKQRVEKYPEKNHDTMKAYYKLGEAYRYKEDYENALNSFQKIANDYPQDPFVTTKDIETAIAECYDAMQEVDNAINHYKIAVATGHPTVINKDVISFRIAQLYEYQENYNEAKIWYQRVVDNYPKSWYAEKATEQIEKIKNK